MSTPFSPSVSKSSHPEASFATTAELITRTSNGQSRSRKRRRGVAAIGFGAAFMLLLTPDAFAAKGKDPADAVRGVTVVGQSGTPAPVEPIPLGAQLERDPQDRQHRRESPGLAKARRQAEQRKRVRDAANGKKRPVSDPDDSDQGPDEDRRNGRG